MLSNLFTKRLRGFILIENSVVYNLESLRLKENIEIKSLHL